MENTSIKKINTAGKIGYVISILLIVCSIVAMVGIGICIALTTVISDNDINIKMATTINIDSTGNFLEKINSFTFINGVEDLNTLIENENEKIELNDEDISEISIKENDGGLLLNAKTNEISISMKKITIALVSVFIYLGAVTVTLYMVKALMKSLKKCETPFAEDVIKNMTRFATSLVCVVILHMILGGVLSSVRSGSKFELSIDLGSILLVAVIYVLITVFKYGAQLQHESDETL